MLKRVRAVVVDDSAFMRKAISDMIESEPGFEVIAKLRDGCDLIEKVDELNPDIITLDIHMKNIDGLATLKELKKRNKSYPIIMVSSATVEGSKITLECLENGAISFITKPSGSISLDIEKVKNDLIEEIKAIVGDKKCCLPAQRIKKDNKEIIEEKKPEKIITQPVISKSDFKSRRIDAIVIGTSTGGPKSLPQVLKKLPDNLNIPVFVVQHMPPHFTKVFAERLDKICPMKVIEAENGMEVKPNTIYIAPGGEHMTIDIRHQIKFIEDPPIWGVKPAADKLFISASKVYNSNLIGVILTGMGRDGADGLRHIKDNGGITISEHQSTCVIYGMPKAAFETGKIDLVLPLDEIGDKIVKITKGV